jgi:hypothetical protein
MNENFVILRENGYMFINTERGDALRKTMKCCEWWWRGPGMVVLRSTKPI